MNLQRSWIFTGTFKYTKVLLDQKSACANTPRFYLSQCDEERQLGRERGTRRSLMLLQSSNIRWKQISGTSCGQTRRNKDGDCSRSFERNLITRARKLYSATLGLS
jgi:hypothetical protein